MRFRYSAYEVDPSPTVPGGVLYRPEVAIDVIGPGETQRIQALVDTGSGETVFPISLAHAIGADLDYALVGQAAAVGGNAIQLVPGVIELQIADQNQLFRWRTAVCFLEVERPEDEIALLGYAGFLEFFTATFDSHSRELELTPNARIRSAKV